MRRIHETIWKDFLPLSSAFTTHEVAEAAEVRLPSASRDLAQLASEGIVVRVRRGLWVIPQHPEFSPYVVVPRLFGSEEQGYVSLLSALNLQAMIEQIPQVIQVVTTRQRPRLRTPVGTYEFHQIQPDLFGGFAPYSAVGSFEIASPEKAVFDTLYISTRRGQRFAHLPEMELPAGFSPKAVEEWIAKIDYEPHRAAVANRWDTHGHPHRKSRT